MDSTSLNTTKEQKTTQKVGVGEEWPKLLTKKFLAGHFGCSSTNGKRFRTSVLSPEILEAAEIPLEIAYSPKLKTFNVKQSQKLTQILRGFCLASIVIFSQQVYSQKSVSETSSLANLNPVKYSLDTTKIDSIWGQCIISDSIVRMVSIGPTGEMRFEKVLSTIVVDVLYTKERRLLVRASDGLTDPIEDKHLFYFLPSMGIIDQNRILLFKQKPRK